ncbi:MAG: 2-oxoacid:acceptor oxidoreductase family protein, partial [Tistlia sp.]
MAISRQVWAEGVKQVVVVSDEPDKYPLGVEWGGASTVRHRDDLDQIQRDLREQEGVTVLIYDQTCAAEKRRRRKRGTFPDPDRRVFINDAVCEACGDCSVKSNCVSVVPVETEFGTKRGIDQSSCNKDFSCLKGFCPSFVTVEGATLHKSKAVEPIVGPSGSPSERPWPVLPEPTLPSLDEPYGILVTGVGGTGVVTIGALLGMAAHIEGKGCSVLDMAGLAQKGGAVLSHIRLAQRPEELHAVRISAGGARLLLGCDLVVAAATDTLSKVREGYSRAIVNDQESVTGDFTRNSTAYRFPKQPLMDLIGEATGAGAADFVSASRIATGLLGDSIASNLFMLGYAWQKGL